ncbi:unnamed protein product [Trichogramma brassicae]|uniref:ARF7 effector protein C-terminal domain-containing protein n=1 Tax=Trichogramma brassicae TaxID=86971 RepID=A0A6H5IWS9_9HYME|nr:unnamed protein product [Trichogramma brassicae]
MKYIIIGEFGNFYYINQKLVLLDSKLSGTAKASGPAQRGVLLNFKNSLQRIQTPLTSYMAIRTPPTPPPHNCSHSSPRSSDNYQSTGARKRTSTDAEHRIQSQYGCGAMNGHVDSSLGNSIKIPAAVSGSNKTHLIPVAVMKPNSGDKPYCFEFNKNGKLVYSDKINFFKGWNPDERERKKLEARIRTITHVASKRSARRELEEKFKAPKERQVLKNILQELEEKPEPAAKPKQVSSKNVPRELEENHKSPEEREILKSMPQKPAAAKPEPKSKSSKPAAKFEPQAKFKTTPKPKTAAKSGESAAKAKPVKRGEIHEQLYDENGIFIPTQENLCDCLDKECPGCHFPCPTCSSTKCGNPCR